MADRKTKSAPTYVPKVDEIAPEMTKLVASVTRMQGHFFDAWMKQNIEMLDFLKARFERDRRLVAQMAEMEDSAEAAKVLSEFWREAVSEYSTEGGKLAGMMSELASEAVRKANEEATTLVEKSVRATPL